MAFPGFFTVDGFHKVLLPHLPAATRQVAGKAGCWASSRARSGQPADANLQQDVITLYTERLCEAVGRDAGRSGPGAAAQPAAGGAGPCTSCRHRNRRCGTCCRHRAATDADASHRRRAAGAAGAAQARQRAPRHRRADQRDGAACRRCSAQPRSPPRPPGKAIDDRYAALIKLVGKGPGRTDRQRAQAAERFAAAASRSWRGAPAGGRLPAIPRRRRPGGAVAGRGGRRSGAGAARWLTGDGGRRHRALRGGGATNQATPRRSTRQAGRPRCASRRSRAAIRSRRLDQRHPAGRFRPAVRAWRPARHFFQRTTLAVRGHGRAGLEAAGGGRRRGRRFRPATWRSSSAPHRSATCSSPPAGTSRAFASTSRRCSTITRQAGHARSGWAADRLRAWTAARDDGDLAWHQPDEQCSPGVRPAAVERTPGVAGHRPLGIVPPVRHGHVAADRQRPTATSSSFTVGDRNASFEIRAGSVLNPFAPGVLRDFQCPGL